MPRLQILHHKSYHPYLEKNKQRVREDEAKAAAVELAAEQLRIDAASSARLDELRKRAGSPSLQSPPPITQPEDDNLPSTSSDPSGSRESKLLEKHRKEKARQEKKEKRLKERLDFDFPSESAKREERRRARKEGKGGDREDMWVEDGAQGDASGVWDQGGHINLFADVEKNERPQPSMAELAKKKKDQEADFLTMYLGRPEKETKPWYTDRELKRYEEKETGGEAEERRARDKRKDVRSKARHDPLTQISTLLASHPASSSKSVPKPRRPEVTEGIAGVDPVSARKSRESAERQRALDLIAKTKAQAQKNAAGNRWDDTPSTIAGGRSWAEDFEREKDRAGMRFFGEGTGDREGGRAGRIGVGWDGRARGGRSWEV